MSYDEKWLFIGCSKYMHQESIDEDPQDGNIYEFDEQVESVVVTLDNKYAFVALRY